MPTNAAGRCEVVAIFHTAEDLEAAIDERLSSGFDRAELSLLASKDAVQRKLHSHYRLASEMADDPGSPRVAFVSTAAIGDAKGGLIGGLTYVGATVAAGAMVLSGGALAPTIAAAVLSGCGGALIGTVLARWVGQHHARYLAEQIDNGDLLLWVRAWDEQDAVRASEILRRHAGERVHTHGAFLAAA